jgi:hypothetical protein
LGGVPAVSLPGSGGYLVTNNRSPVDRFRHSWVTTLRRRWVVGVKEFPLVIQVMSVKAEWAPPHCTEACPEATDAARPVVGPLARPPPADPNVGMRLRR